MSLQHTKGIIRKIFGSSKGKADCGDDSSHSVDGLVEPNDGGHGERRMRPPDACSPQAQVPENSSIQQHTSSPKPLTAASSSGRAPPSGKTAVFFARVPPTATHEELLELFSRFGAVEDLNLFRPFAEAKTSKGCGIVRYAASAAAAAAKATLHNKHKWNEDSTAMVVEWVNEDKMRSACVKAGSNEVVFEPKSRGKHKHSGAGSSSAAEAAGASSVIHPAAAAAAGRYSGSGGFSNLPSPQGPSSVLGPGGPRPLSHSGGFAIPCQPPPPPMPHHPQQPLWQHQPMNWSANPAGVGYGHVSADNNGMLGPGAAAATLAQQQQHQRLMRSSYPGSSLGQRVSSAAAVEQSDIVQAVLAASTGAVGGLTTRDVLIPTYGGFSSGSNAIDAMLLQQQEQQQRIQLALLQQQQGLLEAQMLSSQHSNTSAALAAAAAAGPSGGAWASIPNTEYNMVGTLENALSEELLLQQQIARSACGNTQQGLAVSGSLLANSLQQQQLSGVISAAAASMGPLGSGQILARNPRLSGPVAANLGQLGTQFEEQYDEQWAAAYGAGYFDMPAGNSSSSNSNVAGMFISSILSGLGGNSGSGASVMLGSATAGQLHQHHAVVSSGSESSLLQQQQQQLNSHNNALHALSDPSLVRVGNTVLRGTTAQSFAGGQQHQHPLLQHQLLQQQQQQAVSRGPTAAAAALGLVSSPMQVQQAAAAAALADDLQQRMLLNPSAAAAASGDKPLSVAIATGPGVVPLLAPHIRSITSMTGAAVRIAPTEQGELALYVSGSAEQINTAQGIVDLLLQKQ